MCRQVGSDSFGLSKYLFVNLRFNVYKQILALCGPQGFYAIKSTKVKLRTF